MLQRLPTVQKKWNWLKYLLGSWQFIRFLSIYLVKGGFKAENIFGVHIHHRGSDGVFQVLAKPQEVHNGLVSNNRNTIVLFAHPGCLSQQQQHYLFVDQWQTNSWPLFGNNPNFRQLCLVTLKLHILPKFSSGLTRATPVVIMLPPDAPMTTVCFSDGEWRITGDMEEGGCSPSHQTHTQALLIHAFKLSHPHILTIYKFITSMYLICFPTEVNKFIVEKDACFGR